jgi:predicted transcriptional regulator
VRSATATQINFRADPETKAALDELTADGTAVSEVIRKAIQDARRAARRAKAVAEMEAIMADPEQRRLSAEVYREMSNLSAW